MIAALQTHACLSRCLMSSLPHTAPRTTMCTDSAPDRRAGALAGRPRAGGALRQRNDHGDCAGGVLRPRAAVRHVHTAAGGHEERGGQDARGCRGTRVQVGTLGAGGCGLDTAADGKTENFMPMGRGCALRRGEQGSVSDGKQRLVPVVSQARSGGEQHSSVLKEADWGAGCQ